MITGDEFFQTPRDWSLLKYKILSCYFSQYFPKVNNAFRMGAIVADLFAGRGKFEDGSDGSPLIIANQARIYNERLGFKNQLILAEEIEEDRDQLQRNIQEYIDAKIAIVIPGDALDAGKLLLNSIRPGVPLFVFLDPFGIRGLSVELLNKIFQRAKIDSTELLVNFNHRALPRLAGICKNLNSSNEKLRKQAASVNDMVFEALGGQWFEIMRDETIAEEDRSLLVMEKYIDSYRAAFKWIVKIPVPESFLHGGKPKYFLIFGSRSIVALELMNDCVNRARLELAKAEMKNELRNSLFENEEPAQFIPKAKLSDVGQLKDSVLCEIVDYCNEQANYAGGIQHVVMWRQVIRGRLITKQFSRYSTSEYNESISTLLKEGRLVSENGRTRISDFVRFQLVN